MEQWKIIPEFPNYEVSNYGRVRNHNFDRILALNINQSHVVFVGLFRDHEQYKRSVALLVAKAFLKQPSEFFDTPINLNGDRLDNEVINLMWRPRWFAIKYNRQFREPHPEHIPFAIQDIGTGEITLNSLECAMQYGLLEEDIVYSIMNRTYVWPSYQQFRVIEK